MTNLQAKIFSTIYFRLFDIKNELTMYAPASLITIYCSIPSPKSSRSKAPVVALKVARPFAPTSSAVAPTEPLQSCETALQHPRWQHTTGAFSAAPNTCAQVSPRCRAHHRCGQRHTKHVRPSVGGYVRYCTNRGRASKMSHRERIPN